MTMERRLRLRAEADFARIRSRGRSQGHRLVTLLTLPNGLEHNRYGVIVSKRVGKAVTRNLVKRRLREVLRELDRIGCVALGFDMALIVRPVAAAATFAELRDAVIGLLRRAAIWRPGESRATGIAQHTSGSVGTDQP
jgi:ribonuclease P protein component